MPAAPVNTVPNTTTFDLQDVVDSVNPTTDDLVDCFADADSAQFDPAYEGSKNQLLNFRNYGNQSTGTGVTALDSSNYVIGSYKTLPGGTLGYKPATQKATDGSGTGFTANLYIDAVNVNGRNQYVWNGNYQITNAGSGYAVGDEITFAITGILPSNSIIDARGYVDSVG